MKIKWHAVSVVLFFAGMLLIGISVYHNVEGWNYLDSAYFLVMTATTVGYGDIVPQTIFGKIITMVYSFLGIAFVFYMISLMTHYVLDKRLKGRIASVKGYRKRIKKRR